MKSKQWILFVIFLILLSAAPALTGATYADGSDVTDEIEKDFAFASSGGDKSGGSLLRLDEGTPVILTQPLSFRYYTPSDTVEISFEGNSSFANQAIEVYLIDSTVNLAYSTFNAFDKKDKNDFNALLEGPAKGKFTKYSSVLDDNGNYYKDFEGLEPGHYILAVLLDKGNSPDLTMLSASMFEVVQYPALLTAPSTADPDSDLSINIKVAGPDSTDTYGAVLINKNEYVALLEKE
ncbi:MAG: TIGR04279 domain-containing protein, partial [Clostridia bacterium]|nr:TIGR04279 domain-containing protein [Clostridia bacterium]